jgi:uncharacterized Zn finger protein
MTGWGTDLLFSITDTADWLRVDRGEELHAQGAVLHLSVSPGLVVGLVQGSGGAYHCRIQVDLLPDPHLALLMTFLRHLPRGRTSSLMLSTITLGLSARGVDLGPAGDLPPTVFCECPDEEEYCKHVIALALEACGLFDEDPWSWLEARGLTLPAGAATHAPPADETEAQDRTVDAVPTLEDELATYWTGSGEVSPVAEVWRPATRERDRAELVTGLLPEFTVQGRSRAKALELASGAAEELEALYAKLKSSSTPVPHARDPLDGPS